ncbi:MAG: GNAT family N-acetyltransferase [Bacteroidaceae bacterium]|nr:GNAT family N-acetyltransferase [Bacteroidaceae bacterium]
MYRAELYDSSKKADWNAFVDRAKNSIFLFKRDYMEYHSDRFSDYSLMIYRKDKLFALLPANRVEDTVYSHQGLTFGGLILDSKAMVADVIDTFSYMNEFFKSEGIKKVVYKTLPYIYANLPSEEDRYALFRTTNAQLVARNIASVIYQDNKIKFIESRKSGIRKAKNNNVEVVKSDDYAAFWDILNENLRNKYGAKPVHELSEILLLKERFPDNIQLYLATKDDVAIGGTVLYITNRVAHTQYISASETGKELGALDILFDYIINTEYVNYPIFDFGTSNEDNGHVLNEALIFQKQGFGGRGVIYDIYEYTL